MLPQMLRVFRVTSKTSTSETVNMLMLGKELGLPDLLINNSPPSDHQAYSESVQRMVARLEEAHTLLREQQMVVRQDNSEEPYPLVPDWSASISTEYQKKKMREPQIATKIHRTV